MGGLSHLLDAIGRRLPAGTDRKSLAVALRLAAHALPESRASMRARIYRTEEQCIDAIVKRLAEGTVVMENNMMLEVDDVQDLYEGAADDLEACVMRCVKLLTNALSSLHPEKKSAGCTLRFPCYCEVWAWTR